MSKQAEDVVRAILDRLHSAFEQGAPLQDGEFWAGIEREIRDEYKGRHYISATGRGLDAILGATIERDRQICTEHLRDKISVPALAQKYGLSRYTVWRIVKGHR